MSFRLGFLATVITTVIATVIAGVVLLPIQRSSEPRPIVEYDLHRADFARLERFDLFAGRHKVQDVDYKVIVRNVGQKNTSVVVHLWAKRGKFEEMHSSSSIVRQAGNGAWIPVGEDKHDLGGASRLVLRVELFPSESVLVHVTERLPSTETAFAPKCEVRFEGGQAQRVGVVTMPKWHRTER